MMKHRFSKRSRTVSLAIAATLSAIAIYADTAKDAPAIETTGDQIVVNTKAGRVCIAPMSPEVFRVATISPGEDPASALPQSYASVLSPSWEGINVSATDKYVTVSSLSTTARVDRKTGLVSFLDKDERLMLAETEPSDNSGELKLAALYSPLNGSLYGAGERGHALRLNGDTLVMYNRQNYGYTDNDPRISQMNITIPYVVSDAGYGVLFDDYSRARLVAGDTLRYESESPDPVAYYFINGQGSLRGATREFTNLTGRQELPPFWALGYITSKYGYHNQAETLGAVDSLKNAGYPVDGIVLDLYWYGVETDMGRLSWDKKQWPDHRKMLSDLKVQGVNTVIISQPYLNKKGAIDNYNMLSERGMLVTDSTGRTHDVTTWVGDAGMLDVSNPETREWLWERYRDLTKEGVEGWWGDLGEPEVHPETIRHNNGLTASEYHNLYGNEWSRIIYDGFKKDFPEKRLMTLMRGGTTGLQRYDVFPWSTDVSRSWGGFQPQVKIMLNSGLSGLGYMSSDIGGFAVDPSHPTDEELYVRWLQMGTFTPTLRTHAQLKPEPYHYPASEDITREYVKMRYRWLPYNYTLAYQNAADGLPMARPLNFNLTSRDERFDNVTDEYLWGDDVLVAPVMQRGAKSRKIMLPEGRWYDWFNPTVSYAGGREITMKTPLEKLPLLIRAGAFIPQYDKPIENVTQYDPQFLTVRYFPSAEKTSYTLFDDNRSSTSSLQDKEYQLTTFTGQKEGRSYTITLRAEGRYEGMPQYRRITLEICDVKSAPSSVSNSDGVPLPRCKTAGEIGQSGWSYDPAKAMVTIIFPWEYDSTTIEVISK